MPTSQEDDPDAARREANVQALLQNNLQVQRQPLLSKYLVIKEGEQVLRRQFKSPAPGAPALSDGLRKRLLARKHFVPWGASKPFVHPILPTASQQQQLEQLPLQPEEPQLSEEPLPTGIEPLVLWEQPAAAAAAADGAAEAEAAADGQQQPSPAVVVVDPMLTRWLRPHQREGVQFMFDCVCGLRLPGGQGCILADDMGLGKTLQGITLMWTLLQQGAPALGGVPIAKRAIIVCPTSLVSNWAAECDKWLKGRCRTLPLCESSREHVVDAISTFVCPPARTNMQGPYHCLIISYETFRLHAARLAVPGACDLLICDEAHRLKNDSTLTNRALDSLPCKRRVLLSGTPMQNHLDEFYAMVDFCNPGCLGTPAEFRRHFESPILAGREPGAAPEVTQLGEERSTELSALVNNFILRRTNKLLSDHLPPKVVQVVCCRLTPLQQALYEHFLLSNATRRLLSGSKATGVLSAITSLKKLCNHPKLIYDTLHSKAQADGTVAEGFEGVGELMPPGLFDNGRPGRGDMALGWEELSGKLALVARLLAVLRETSDDKVVIVSNYTQTLDLFATLCRQRGYQFVRLDGSTSISKRQKLVQQLNAPGSQVFVFLLSSKAGGCGLNLVGANRLILFDPDWNPATDKQAAARVWRDGQKKRVYVYRLLSAGSIEEKVFQRQISKEGLQQVVDNAAAAGGGDGAAGSSNGGGSIFGAGDDEGAGGSGSKGQGGGSKGLNTSLMSAEELRELFSLRTDVASDTYEAIRGGTERAAAQAAAAAAAAAAGIGPAGGAGSKQQQPRQQGRKKQQQRGRRRGRRRGVVSDTESSSSSSSDEDDGDDRGGFSSDSMDLLCCSSGSGDLEEAEGDVSKPAARPGPVLAAAATVTAEAEGASPADSNSPESDAGMGSPSAAAAAGAAVLEVEADGAAAAPACEDAAAEAAAATQGMAALAMVDGYRPQIGAPSEEDLQRFGHHTAEALSSVPDEALRAAAAAGEPVITFVFSCQVAGRLDICQPAPPAPKQQQQLQHGRLQQHQRQQQQRPGGQPSAGRLAAGGVLLPGGGSSSGHPPQGLSGMMSILGGSGSVAGRKRFSAPAAVPSKRSFAACEGGAAAGAAAEGAAAQEAARGASPLHAGGARRHSMPAAAAAAKQQGGTTSSSSRQAALGDASSRLNSSAAAGGSVKPQQQLQQLPAGGEQSQQQQQQQEAGKRQKIALKPKANSKAAAPVVDVISDQSSDWDDDDFM